MRIHSGFYYWSKIYRNFYHFFVLEMASIFDFSFDREKGLELFTKFIRTKNVDSLQGEQPRRGGGPRPTGSKQKLQVLINN